MCDSSNHCPIALAHVLFMHNHTQQIRLDMRKSDKKLENAIRLQLTEVCEFALEHTEGFLWLTHTANFKHFPGSLEVRCVFAEDYLQTAIENTPLNELIKQNLKCASIDIQSRQIRYTAEVIH